MITAYFLIKKQGDHRGNILKPNFQTLNTPYICDNDPLVLHEVEQISTRAQLVSV